MSGSARDAVDFDKCADRQSRDAHGGSGRTSLGGKVALVTFVKVGVVAFEFGQKAPALDDMAELEVQFRKDQREVVHHAGGLRNDAFGERRVRGVGVGWHLPGQNDPAIGFNGVAEGGYWARSACKKVEFRGHDDVLGGGLCRSSHARRWTVDGDCQAMGAAMQARNR
jgi:hypothetical protein